MSNVPNDQTRDRGPAMPNRRKLLAAGLGVAAAAVVTPMAARAQGQQVGQSAGGGPLSTQSPGAPSATSLLQATRTGRRRLGSLEVSALGLGC